MEKLLQLIHELDVQDVKELELDELVLHEHEKDKRDEQIEEIEEEDELELLLQDEKDDEKDELVEEQELTLLLHDKSGIRKLVEEHVQDDEEIELQEEGTIHATTARF